MENNIQVLSNVDLNKNDITNAHVIKNNEAILAFENSSLAIDSTSFTSTVDSTSITQTESGVLLSATDSSKVSINTDSIDIHSNTITMSHPDQEDSSIQFVWDGKTLIIGKKSSN